jgi:hypothetical protein
VEWFQSEEVDELLEPSAVIARMRKIQLETHIRVKRSLSRKARTKLAEKEIFRGQVGGLAKCTVSTFRSSFPAKYQCCQCQRAFVLFTDYFVHFTHSVDESLALLPPNPMDSPDSPSPPPPAIGLCRVTTQRGLFFPRYWIKADWQRQRQCEYEVLRLRDEVSTTSDASTLATFADITDSRSKSVRKALKLRQKQAAQLYREKLAEVEYKALKTTTIQMIVDAVTVCAAASAGVNFGNLVSVVAEMSRKSKKVSTSDKATESQADKGPDMAVPALIVECVLTPLDIPMNNSWLASGQCDSLYDLIAWLTRYLPETAGGTAQYSDRDSYSDNANNKKLKSITKSAKNGKPGAIVEPTVDKSNAVAARSATARLHSTMFRLNRMWTATQGGRLIERCGDLGEVRLGVLRMLYITNRTQLFALVDFRTRRPRK